MTFRLELSPTTRADLVTVHDWIVGEADDDVADAYLRRVIAKLATLVDFPNRRTPRPELGRDIRSISFERRLIIAYRVEADIVTILRVVDGARDLGRLFC